MIIKTFNTDIFDSIASTDFQNNLEQSWILQDAIQNSNNTTMLIPLNNIKLDENYIKTMFGGQPIFPSETSSICKLRGEVYSKLSISTLSVAENKAEDVQRSSRLVA